MTDIPVARAKIDRPDATVVRLRTMPPSVNAMYVNVPGRGRAKSKKYADWLSAEGWNLASQRRNFRYFKEPVEVSITVPDAKPAFDADNRIKPTLDLLVKHGLIADDNSAIVRRVQISISDDPKFEGVEVRIEPRRAG